jgi:hypothetical protein
MILLLTTALNNNPANKRSTVEVNTDDVLSVATVGGNTVVSTTNGDITVLEGLSDVELQYSLGAVDPPNGRDRKFALAGFSAANITALAGANINTIQALVNRALSSDVQFAAVATLLGVGSSDLAAMLMKCMRSTGYLPPGRENATVLKK